MKKTMKDKLALNKETLRTLTGLDMGGVEGAGTTRTTSASNVTDTCETCAGPSCGATSRMTGTSACC